MRRLRLLQFAVRYVAVAAIGNTHRAQPAESAADGGHDLAKTARVGARRTLVRLAARTGLLTHEVWV